MARERFQPADYLFTPAERALNINIAQRLKNLLEMNNASKLIYKSVMDANVRVSIEYCDEFTGGEDFYDFPNMLTPPGYTFQIYTYGAPLHVIFSDGRKFPSRFFGSDKKLYEVGKVDMFDLAGNAVTLEEIQQMVPEPRDEARRITPRFSYSSDEEITEELVPITEQERQIVLLHLTLLETGQFELIDSLT